MQIDAIFCHNLRAFSCSKIEPKSTFVEKKWQISGLHLATATQAFILCTDRTTMACLLVIISEHIQHESVQSQPAGSSFQGRKLIEHWSTCEQACLEFFKIVNHVPKVLSWKRKNIPWTVWTLRCYEDMFPYMQKTCDVAEKAILAKKKIAEKVRKSRQKCVNRENR